MLSKSELESSYRSLVGLHKGGGLSEPGLVDALVLLAVEFASGDDPEITARRRRLIDGEQSYRKVTAAKLVSGCRGRRRSSRRGPARK